MNTAPPIVVAFAYDPATGNITPQIPPGVPLGVILLMAHLLVRAVDGAMDEQQANGAPKLAIARVLPGGKGQA